MPPEITLAQFNRIATGKYNAGLVDFETENGVLTGNLTKVNNHRWKTSENNTVLSPERVLEVKEAFIAALTKGGVSAEDIKTIRTKLGIPAEMNSTSNKEEMKGILEKRFRPLTRQYVRKLLDQYARGGIGYNQETLRSVAYEDLEAAKATANMSKSNADKRKELNTSAMELAKNNFDYKLTDALSILSLERSLADLDAAQGNRIQGENAINERNMKKAELLANFTNLFTNALKLLSDNVHETEEFRFCGENAKLVKGDDGQLSAIIGKGVMATKVSLGYDAQSFVYDLFGRTVKDMDTLGGVAVKNLLDKVYDKDLEGFLTAADRTSLTRQFASLIIAVRAGENAIGMQSILDGHFNTGILVEIANRSLEENGERPVTLQALENLHAKLVKDNAGLDEDMKKLLMEVANVPFAKPEFDDSEFMVQAPIVGDVDKVAQNLIGDVQNAPQNPPGPVSAADVKDFVADLIFSDDTMVADVVVNKPGESMRKFLSDPKRAAAFAEIIKNPEILKSAAAKEIADTLKDGFTRLAAILSQQYAIAYPNENFETAKQGNDFAAKLSAFIQDSNKLPGNVLAQFDGVIQSMANKGCEKLQSFINEVFEIKLANINDQGSLVKEPYKNKSAEDIKADLDKKSLNEILDSASNTDVPGQIGFFKQVMSTYFLKLAKADKRSCFAASLRYAQTFEFGGLKDDALKSAMGAATNKFASAILKGTSPLLQKMMQGLPKDVMGGFADALADMKTNLAPIPRKVVQAHLMSIIKNSNNKIKAIELRKSLGAASVGEAFLCKFTYIKHQMKMKQNPHSTSFDDVVIPDLDQNGQPQFEDVETTDDFVVKIMRHDAEARVTREAEIFTAEAKTISGMEKTWAGQLAQYMKEFDFTTEAKNINVGQQLYAIKDNDEHPLEAMAPDVDSMKISTLVAPQKNVLVAEVANGSTVDTYFKENINEIRNAVSAVFERDPATKRIKWKDGPLDPETGKPKKIPVLKENFPSTAPANIKSWIASNYDDIKQAQDKLIQATKVWFHEALLGSGNFHGDTHSGNLMVGANSITFIDFGNLYQLKKRDKLDAEGNVVNNPTTNQPVRIDERVELLRVMLGATMRDSKFFLQGFENLLSPAGKQALATNRAKAEAILESVLAKGKFSYDIAYRLQAAIIELQKLGLELPPQINCFIQSMVRLQNTISEMNTILNQSRTLLETTNNINRPPQQRDELDIIGKAFDFACSPEGKAMVPVPDNMHWHGKTEMTAYQKFIFSEEMGGKTLMTSPFYRKGGEYYEKVATRLGNAEAPGAEVDIIVNMLKANADIEHNVMDKGILGEVDKAVPKFKAAIAAAKTPEDKRKAIDDFCDVYSGLAVRQMVGNLQHGENFLVTAKIKPPSTFSSAIMSVLFVNSDAVDEMMDGNFTNDEKSALRSDIANIATSELNVSKAKLVGSVFGSFFGGEDPETVVKKAIINDAKTMAGDKSYQVDIGV